MKQPCVYILANKFHGRLYIGVTSDLVKRNYEHRNEIIKGHTSKYEIKNLVWFETHETMESAITREKLIKRWKREFKYNLIEKDNPSWKDLYNSILGNLTSRHPVFMTGSSQAMKTRTCNGPRREDGVTDTEEVRI